MTRANRPEVRNPVLALPAAAGLADLDPAARAALRAVLVDIGKDAHTRAEAAWARRKAPMAAYWRAVGVYATHIARAIGKAPRGRAPLDPARSMTHEERMRRALAPGPDSIARLQLLRTPAEDRDRCPHGMFYSGAGACPACTDPDYRVRC